MNIRHSPPLVESFLEDHRRMTKLIARLHDALGRDARQRVRELAERLDRVAGPHIDFEEQVLYPLIGEVRDQNFANHLYGEHRVVRQALEQFLTTEAASLDEATLVDLRKGLGVGLEHAASCGTLVSHLDALSPEAQTQALRKLRELRREGRRWTELPPRAATGEDTE